MVATDMATSKRPPTPTKKSTADTTTWLTRIDIADMLRISDHTIRAWERKGRLNPQRVVRQDAAGHERPLIVYDPREVAKLPRRVGVEAYTLPAGEIAARAFELFEAGKTVREIVVELRETPDNVLILREKWLDAGGAELVLSPAAKEALEGELGAFETVAELVERVAKPKPKK